MKTVDFSYPWIIAIAACILAIDHRPLAAAIGLIISVAWAVTSRLQADAPISIKQKNVKDSADDGPEIEIIKRIRIN